MTVENLKEFDLTRKEAERSKNMFALGLLSWLYGRPTEGTERFLAEKFGADLLLAAPGVCEHPGREAGRYAKKRRERRDHDGLGCFGHTHRWGQCPCVDAAHRIAPQWRTHGERHLKSDDDG